MVEMNKAPCGKKLQSFVGTLIQTDTSEEATVGIPGVKPKRPCRFIKRIVVEG